MSNPNRLTTKEVARICRVSDATVKRWASAGLIKSEKTNGGHRRFRAEDVAAFQCEQGLGLANQIGDHSLVTATARTRVRKILGGSEFLRSMICGCEEEVSNFLIKRYLDGESLESILDNTIAEELRIVGELWEKGEVSVAEEHLASRTVSYALFKIRTILTARDQNQKLAICFGIEGDQHGLATDLARTVFESGGWSVLNFGPNIPFFSLHSQIKCNKPDIICIAGTILEDVERLTMDYSEFAKKAIEISSPKFIIGGRAFRSQGIRERFPADFYPDRFQDLGDILRTF